MGNGRERTLVLYGTEFLGCLQFLRQFGPYCHSDLVVAQTFISVFINGRAFSQSFEGYISQSSLQLKLYFCAVDPKNRTIPTYDVSSR